MPAAARIGIDSAGGVIDAAPQTTVLVNGSVWAVVGSTVQSHGSSPHNAATMTEGSATVFAGGISVCRAGDRASCGHLISGGSANVLAGG